MKRVGFGFLGTTLDAYGGFGAKRHSTWRPTVSFGTEREIGLDRLELWYPPRYQKLANIIKEDIESQPHAAKVVLRPSDISDPWNFEEVYRFLYDFTKGYQFDLDREEYFIHLTTGTHVAQICLFLLTETRHFPAKLAQTSPRRGEGEPSFSIIDLDLSQYDKLAARFEKERVDDRAVLKAGINTKNAAFNKLIAEVEVVSRSSKDPLLLLGPTGAGKSHLAKQVYSLKASHHQLRGEFVEVNCATIRGEQAISTLFGHVKGAFTGALSKRDGFIKKANGGLLFLDEIGELGLDEQGMLLRAVEEKRFFPLGSDHEEESDFQLICGTNRDLAENVRSGCFREDLFHRINMWTFTLPGLAERKEDIEPNLEYELDKFEQRLGRRVTMNSEARTAYLGFATSAEAVWPGNFRDLNASVSRMATLSPQGRITASVVDVEIRRLRAQWASARPVASQSFGSEELLSELGIAPEMLDPFDRVQLQYVLQTLRESASLADAGRKLFAVSRKGRTSWNDSDRVRKFLARFGIDSKRVQTRRS